MYQVNEEVNMTYYTRDMLEDEPTLYTGQCCNCKVDTGLMRVWLCRVGGGVTIETLIDGRWEITDGGCYEV